MKKKIFLAIGLLCLQQTLHAQAETKPAQTQVETPKCSDKIILEARASYFRPFNETVRHLFHNGGVDYALQATFPVWRGLNIWSAVDYFSRSGTMRGINRSTHIMIVPITLGLKYIYSVTRHYGIYGGVAAKYYFVEVVNRVYPFYDTYHRNGLGGVIEIGNLICLGDHFVIDIFGSASFKKVDGQHDLPPNAHTNRLNVGGWNVGAGLGYKF